MPDQSPPESSAPESSAPAAPALNELAFSVETECGCNERPVVLRALRDAIRDFCIRSESWVYEIVHSCSGESSFDCVGTNDAYVHRILDVFKIVNGNMHRISPVFYSLQNNMVLIPKLGTADQVKIISVLIPNPDSAALPEEMLTRFHDGIVYGACMRIVRQAGKPWFSPELEQMFQLHYLREVTKAITMES